MPHAVTATLSHSAIVGANVRAELGRRGESQGALALALGISQSGVSKRLRGVTPFDVDELARTAEWLAVPLAVLLEGVDTDAPRERSPA